MCSKLFYVLVHKNNRHELKLDHSYRILSSKNVFDRYHYAWISFNYQLSSKLDLTENLMFAVKDKILNDIIFETLPFRVYDICFFVTDTFIVKNIAVFVQGFHVRDKVLSHFLNQKVTYPVLFFPKELLSDNIFVADDMSLFVCYYGIIYSAHDNNFENYYGNFGVIYYESVNSVFMLYKIYLEVLCRVIFNSVLKKVLTIILKNFDLNTSSSSGKRSFCNKDSSCFGK